MFGLRLRKRKSRRTSLTTHYTTYKSIAKHQITKRVHEINSLYNHNINLISVRNQRTRWGSCSEHGNLNFSYRLIFLPPEICDYVIVHELCHLAELNHSTTFWALVETTIPNYKALKRRLRTLDVRTLPRKLTTEILEPV